MRHSVIYSVALCVLSLFLFIPLADAHSSLAKLSPENGEVLEAPPQQVELWFNQNVKVSSDSIQVQVDGKSVMDGEPAVDPQDKKHVIAPLSEEAGGGNYVVTFYVISADGHPIEGSYSFEVSSPTVSQEKLVQGPSGAVEKGETGEKESVIEPKEGSQGPGSNPVAEPTDPGNDVGKSPVFFVIIGFIASFLVILLTYLFRKKGGHHKH